MENSYGGRLVAMGSATDVFWPVTTSNMDKKILNVTALRARGDRGARVKMTSQLVCFIISLVFQSLGIL